MPTIVITGHPSSGKTTFARLLAERATKHSSGLIKSAVIINEESACPGRTKSECYADSPAEKKTRAALKSEFDKYCTSASDGGKKDERTRLVILDSLNYIKGYRYELHCIAKAAGERHAIVWILNDPEVSKGWNRKRREAGQNKQDDGATEKFNAEDWYRDDDMLDELMHRYEPPDERNRWDKPLYRVDGGSILSRIKADGYSNGDDVGESSKETSTADSVLCRTVYDMHSLGEAIGSDAASSARKPASISTNETVSTSRKSMGSSFKRSAAAGFKRNKARGTALTGASAYASCSTGLTAEGLASLAVSNGDTAGLSQSAGPSLEPSVDEKIPHPENSDKTEPVPTSVGKAQTMEELADEILDSFLTNVVPLKVGMSTATPVTAGANVLNDVDIITQRAITAFLTAQRGAAAVGGGAGGGKLVIPVGSGCGKSQMVELKVNRTAQVTELKRLRRQYVKWVSAHPPEDASEVGVASSFLSYVESQL